jgi:hypothetical protein
MKRFVMVLAAVMALVPASLWAQDAPKAEVFGGFSVLTINDSSISGSRYTPLGFQASVAGNMGRFGIEGDFGGQYKDGGSIYQYMGGPRVTHSLEKASVFAHALFGGSRASGGSGSGSINGFTMAYGGGVDVAAGDNIAIRVVQVDWLPTRFSSGGVSAWVKNAVRFGFGVVYKVN